MAGVPRRMPEVTIGFSVSFGMPFLLQVMSARSEHVLGLLAGEALRAQVDQHHVVFGAAGDDARPRAFSTSPSACAFCDDLVAVGLELGLQRLAERHRLAGDHVHQRAALQAGEDGAVDLLRDVFVFIRMKPPRGPRSVLCVVEVTTSACGTGFGCTAGGDQAGDSAPCRP